MTGTQDRALTARLYRYAIPQGSRPPAGVERGTGIDASNDQSLQSILSSMLSAFAVRQAHPRSLWIWGQKRGGSFRPSGMGVC